MEDRRLRIRLLGGWSDHSHENPGGAPTYMRDLSATPGALQFSLAQYRSEPEPRPSGRNLIELAAGLGAKLDQGQLLGVSSGPCAFGCFGTAVFRSREFARAQFWYVSNGRDFILATHFSQEEPEQAEVDEAEWIVRNVTTTAARSD